MITAVIIDDVQKNVLMLASMLQRYCPQVSLLGTANNAIDGKELINNVKPQIVFLDVEMPYGSGFDLLQSMPGINAEIIFVTAYGEYAIRAFRFAALDYLLKPVNLDELIAAVQRAEQKANEQKAAHHYDIWLRNMNEKDVGRQSVSFSENGNQYIVQLADVMYIIADGSYTHVHTINKTIVTTKSLKDFEGMFPPTLFCRIHHGHMVNMSHIVKLQKGRGGKALMKDGRVLEISVRRKEDLMVQLRK